MNVSEESRFVSLANKYKILRWTVAAHGGQWFAFDPSATGSARCRVRVVGQFSTFEEAINYATEQARA